MPQLLKPQAFAPKQKKPLQAFAPKQAKPLQWEAHLPQQKVAPAHHNYRESPHAVTKDLAQSWINKDAQVERGERLEK